MEVGEFPDELSNNQFFKKPRGPWS